MSITLTSKDGVKISCLKKAAMKFSIYIFDTIDEQEDDIDINTIIIPVRGVNIYELRKIVEYMEYHYKKMTWTTEFPSPLGSESLKSYLGKYDSVLLYHTLKLSKEKKIFTSKAYIEYNCLYTAADYMNIPLLHNLLAAGIADIINNLKNDEICDILDIPLCDCTVKQIMEIDKQKSWISTKPELKEKKKIVKKIVNDELDELDELDSPTEDDFDKMLGEG